MNYWRYKMENIGFWKRLFSDPRNTFELRVAVYENGLGEKEYRLHKYTWHPLPDGDGWYGWEQVGNRIFDTPEEAERALDRARLNFLANKWEMVCR